MIVSRRKHGASRRMASWRSKARGRTNVANGKSEAAGSRERERERSLLLLLARAFILMPALFANLAPGHVRGDAPAAGLGRAALAARRPRRGLDFGGLRRTGKRERRAVSQKRTGAEDVGRSRSREGSGKNGNVRTSFLWHALQIHGAPSMRFDLDQDDTASTPASHEAQTRSTGASLPQHFLQSRTPSVTLDLSISPASAPAIPQQAQLPRVAASYEGT